MTHDSAADKDIPHRFWLLVMLRAMARGHALVVTGPSSFQSFLDGLPHVAILFQYILDHEWIAERESRDGIHFSLVASSNPIFKRLCQIVGQPGMAACGVERFARGAFGMSLALQPGQRLLARRQPELQPLATAADGLRQSRRVGADRRDWPDAGHGTALQYGDDGGGSAASRHFPTLLGRCHFAAAADDYLRRGRDLGRCAGGCELERH